MLIPYAVALVAASLALAAHCGLSFRRGADAAQDLAPAASARSAAGAVAAALAFVGETAHVLVFGPGHFGYASTGPKAGSNIWYVLAYLLLVGLSALLLWRSHKMTKSQRRA